MGRLTFDQVRAGLDQFGKVKRDNYPDGPEGESVYRGYLVSQIYRAMHADSSVEMRPLMDKLWHHYAFALFYFGAGALFYWSIH